FRNSISHSAVARSRSATYPTSASRSEICSRVKFTKRSFMQPKLVRRGPGAPVIMRHRDVRRAEELECIVDRIGKARHATHIRALADALGADRMLRRRRRGPV